MSGFVDVAFVVDVYAQKVVAWHAATSMVTDLVMTPLRMALWQRGREGHPARSGELITTATPAPKADTPASATQKHLALEIRPSIGTVGDAYDNALMESINGLYKSECIRTTVFHDGPHKSLPDVEFATAGWVDWYNNRRLHSSLGRMAPVEYEQAHYTTLNREPKPAWKRQKTWGASGIRPRPKPTRTILDNGINDKPSVIAPAQIYFHSILTAPNSREDLRRAADDETFAQTAFGLLTDNRATFEVIRTAYQGITDATKPTTLSPKEIRDPPYRHH